MFRKLLVFPIFAFVLQAQMHVPQVGTIRCADQSVRPVYGLPASFVLGKPVVFSAVSSSFSESGGIVATRDAVQLMNAAGKPIERFEAADSGALVDMGTGASSAIAWLPGTSSIVYWESAGFHQVTLSSPLSGRVTSLHRDGSRALLRVLEDDSITEFEISLNSGNILSSTFLNGVAAPAFRHGEFVLSPDVAGLQISGPDGMQSIDVAGSGLSMERMGSQWVHVWSADSKRHWALHLTSKIRQLDELPACASLEAAR